MTINQDYIGYWAHGDYAYTGNPSLVNTTFVQCSNYAVSGITEKEFVTALRWSSTDVYNNYSGWDVWLHLNPDLALSGVASLADMQGSVRLYGTHYDSFFGSNGGVQVGSMRASRTSAYVDLTRNLSANKNTSGNAVLSGNGTFYDISSIVAEMVAADRSSHSQPHLFGLLIIQDVEQNTGTSADIAVFHSPVSSQYDTRVAADDAARVYVDIPQQNVSLGITGSESASQCHDALPPKGLGDSGASQGLGEDFWFLPRVWKEVDEYTGPNNNPAGIIGQTTLMTEKVGKYGSDLSYLNSTVMDVWKDVELGYGAPEMDSEGLYRLGDVRPGGTYANTAYVDYTPVNYYYGKAEKSLLVSQSDWTISFWEKKHNWTSANESHILNGNGMRQVFGDSGFPGMTSHNGFHVATALQPTQSDPDVYNVEIYFGYSEGANSGANNHIHRVRQFDLYTDQTASLYNRADWNWWMIEQSSTEGFCFYLNGVKLEIGTHGNGVNNSSSLTTLGDTFDDTEINENSFNTYFVGAADPSSYGTSQGTFEGWLDDIRVYRRTLSSQEQVVLETRGNLGSNPLLSLDSVESSSESSESRVDRHNLLLVGSESSSRASRPSLSLSYSADAESVESQAQNLEAAVPIPATSDSVQSSSECSQADVARGIGLSPDSSQSSSQNQRVNLDLSGAANSNSVRVNAECESVNLNPDRVLEGLGGETSWVSASRDNDNEDTAATEDFVDGNSDLTVQSSQWQDDAGNGGDHAFITSSEVQISGDLF